MLWFRLNDVTYEKIEADPELSRNMAAFAIRSHFLANGGKEMTRGMILSNFDPFSICYVYALAAIDWMVKLCFLAVREGDEAEQAAEEVKRAQMPEPVMMPINATLVASGVFYLPAWATPIRLSDGSLLPVFLHPVFPRDLQPLAASPAAYRIVEDDFAAWMEQQSEPEPAAPREESEPMRPPAIAAAS